MILFRNDFFLWLLVLVPLIPVLFAIVRRRRVGRIRKLGDEELVRNLMPSYSGAKAWIRIVLFDLAFLFFVIGLSRPQIGAKLTQREVNGAEIMVCLDVSNSMLAEDYSPNRLERAKLAISRIADKLQDDRIGLVIFAGKPFVQLPVTADYVSAKMFLGNVNTGSVPEQGTAIAAAVRMAAGCFSEQSRKSRAIIVITDGENHEDDPVEAVREAAEAGIRVFTIGVGSSYGKPIPVKGGGLLKDSEGNTVVTKLDEEILMEMAKAGNGAYVHAGDAEFGLNPIIKEIREMEDEKHSSLIFEEFKELYMYFFAVALALLVLEMLIGERKLKRRLFE